MGKFDGILLCTDLDDTLLTTDKRVSDADTAALKYFMDNGGLYTYATGRVPRGIRSIRTRIEPNTPMICYNGAAVYDLEKEEFLWLDQLDNGAIRVTEYVDKYLPYAGIETSTQKAVYFNKVNRIVEAHKAMEKFPDNYCDYHDVKEPFMKLIFMVEADMMAEFKEELSKTEFFSDYEFIQSSPWYYEVLPKGASKGAAIFKLKDITGAKFTVGMGDNENDITLVKNADFGAAVKNAADCVKKYADYITVNDNNNSAVAEIINMLDKGMIDICK